MVLEQSLAGHPLSLTSEYIVIESSQCFHQQRKTLIALEKEDEEERNKTIESLKTALRTQPMRYTSYTDTLMLLFMHTCSHMHAFSYDVRYVQYVFVEPKAEN